MEARLWLKAYIQFEKYSSQKILVEFLKKRQKNKTEHANNKELENRKHDRRHKISRLKHARIEENVTTVDEMVGLLNHKGQKQTYRPTRQISKGKDLTQCSIVQNIYCVCLSKVFFVY